MKRRCCLVTGASSGIGREFARQLAPRTSSLILVARRLDRLENLRDELAQPGLEIYIRRVDLTDAHDLDSLIGWLPEFPLDLLINNAGVGDNGPFVSSDWRRIRRMLDLNIAALTHLTLGALPILRRHEPASILNVASLAALLPIPGMIVYAATKAYILSFSEGLRCELARDGINVTAVCPGPVPTEFEENAVRPDNPAPLNAPDFFIYPVDKVVGQALDALDANTARKIPGKHIAAAMTLVSLLPLRFLRWGLTRRFKA